ncbi:MAG TPA: PQQ-dependent sugar dehydrogenase [Thermoanaerobaculia bacterium]
MLLAIATVLSTAAIASRAAAQTTPIAHDESSAAGSAPTWLGTPARCPGIDPDPAAGPELEDSIPATSAASAPEGGGPPPIQLQTVITGLEMPVAITHAGDGSGRLFITEQEGRIRVWKNGVLLPTPFLDIGCPGPNCRVACCGEEGLLSVAFHPDYASNGFFYVYYNTLSADHDLRIARYHNSNPADDVADSTTEAPLLTIPHPVNGNHNGGQLQFGPAPNRYLYAGIGDGGAGNDPPCNAQNPTVLLGKMLRLDVNQNVGTPPYHGIPPTNPYAAAGDGIRDEIWAFGLRNPFRFSFDRLTGDLFIGDVGQNAMEEIDFEAASSPGGLNFGWKVMEGTLCGAGGTSNCPPGTPLCNSPAYTLPILTHPNPGLGTVVTGGYRHRGADYPHLNGVYIYGDAGSGRIWGGLPDGGGGWTRTELLPAGTISVVAFGEDEAGRLYVSNYYAGEIRRVHSPSFTDVPLAHFAYLHVQGIYNAQITAGCGPGVFCPNTPITRAQVSVFLLRGKDGPGFVPPPATGMVFGDVPQGSFAAAWIEELADRNITAGCGGGNYCPNAAVTRDQMAVMLLRTEEGSGYNPPPCAVPSFTDVPCSNPYSAWIYELVARGIAAGCGGNQYCPMQSVTRGEMAVFVTTTFGLPIP